jgi:serine/threonine-protein kinase
MVSSPPNAKYAQGVVIGGKYRLERKLGEGGMGSVWAAHHEHLDTAVAIKVIRSGIDPLELGPRLLQEARAAAKLGHPHIVRVFDVGQTADGDPFIVMELLEGQSLGAYLTQQQRLSATEAVQLLLPIADALRVAHAKGIVHRDIKPDNVFLVREETGVQPKLVDFGIAKFGPREPDSQLTQRGAIVGSPDYMAPEQARGEEDIDRRADVWAFSVVLYEAMSGRAPFTAANHHALLRAIIETTPAPLRSLLAADIELSQIVETGMAKDRQQRYQSMQELGEALARWLLKQGVIEDASGGSVEAKWVLRRSDPGARQSRASMGSISDISTTTPGLGQSGTSPTELRRVGEAPTSVGPVVTGASHSKPRRLLVPLALALLAVVGFALNYPRGAPNAGPPVASTVAAAPSAVPPPPAAPAPPEPPEPPEPASARASAETTPPGAPAAVPAPAAKSERPRSRRPSKPAAEQPPAKAGLDLLAPY